MNDSFLRTPCYIFSRDDFEHNIKAFKSVLRKYFGSNWILGYSFKTNYLPYLLKSAKSEACYAEVVSSKEYLLAKAVGFDSGKIIFNGPVKQKSHFLEAVKNECIVNIDSEREIKWLDELPVDNKYRVGIRVNFDLEKKLPGHTLMASEGGRFGFCIENGELSRAIYQIKKLGNVEINCLHMHVSSRTKSVDIYRQLIKKAVDVIDKEHLTVKYIDVGGSFFGGGDDGSSYETYIKAIKEELIEFGKNEMGIIVEPGASVVATSVKYLVEVVDTKATLQNKYVVTDGSRLHIDPFFTKTKYSYQIIGDENREYEAEQTIAGFTCMEKDRFMKVENEKKLKVGDRILFNTVGSYTMCMNSDFISSEPRVYSEYNGKLYLVRNEKEISDYIDRDILEEVQ